MLKIVEHLKQLAQMQRKAANANALSDAEKQALIDEHEALWPKFLAEIESLEIVNFIELVCKTRAAQKAYFASRANKDAPKSHTDEALRRSKALEAELDKELEAYRKPPTIF